MKFYETPEFRALQRKCYRELADSGFRDIETADGELLADRPRTYPDAELVELGRETLSRAEAALSDEMVWAGLTAGHRKFWALVVMGLSIEAAGKMIHGVNGGRGRARSHEWHLTIMEGIEK